MTTIEERIHIVDELLVDFHGKTDGKRANILVEECPVCHKSGYKYGIYIGPDTSNKTFGSSHCFKCGASFRTLKETLGVIGREDLLPKPVTDLNNTLSYSFDLFEDEIDDGLVEVEMPDGYKRTFYNDYLNYRGFVSDDYVFFECGTNRAMDWRLNDYIIFPIIDDGIKVGYVCRHIWDKSEIDDYNDTHRAKIRRYVNSTENGFGKLLYNYDTIKRHETNTVILVEGVFDVIALTRKMNLYENTLVVPVCTFGKKVSDTQLYKLQIKGVSTVIIAYDADAVETTKKVGNQVNQYFDTYVVDLSNAGGKDFDEMTSDEILGVFANNIMTVREFNLQ